tara:strand:- start:2293 stop:2670 length:378 start_codon:yes stop_codon:yes gene_type:complete
MKLKSVMQEGFLREFTNPSFLPTKLPSSKSGMPCSVKGNSKWKEGPGFSSKGFYFSSRIQLHSFCRYIFDLEQQHGIKVSLEYSHDTENAKISVPHKMLSGSHFRAFFLEIDNIYHDVIASFNNG